MVHDIAMTQRRIPIPAPQNFQTGSHRTHCSNGGAPSWTTILPLFLAAALFGCGSGEHSATRLEKPSARDRQSARPREASAKPVPAVRDHSTEIALDAGANTPSQTPGPAGASSSSPGQLPVYELLMDPKSLADLERSAYSNTTQPARFLAAGESYDRVQVRYRGAWARSWPKKPLRIIFPKEKPFLGQSRINLNSGWRDPAFIREHLAYHLYAACGVPASRTRMVSVKMNGQFRGLYIEVEQPEKAFAGRLNFKGATIFKASSRANQADERDLGAEAAYRGHYEQETQKSEGYAELQRFCRDLARATDVAGFFQTRVDLEKYINYLAVSVLIQNWDAYNKNHFIVYDGNGSTRISAG